MQKKSAPKPGELYTSDALSRFGKPRSAPISPTRDAIGALQRFLDANVNPEGGEQLFTVYSGLCEWAHPSQTSLMYAHTSLGGPVPSSRFGLADQKEVCEHMVAWTLGNISVLWIVGTEVEDILLGRLREYGTSLLPKISRYIATEIGSENHH